jgi:glycosyltransferase involved in cell wall biosynthesis
MPKVSIIIPVYNEEKMIAKTLQEVFNLNLDKEIIVIDDASIDNTAEQLKKLQENFNFQLITIPKNRGKGNAIRAGIRQASGYWAIVFDADLEYKTSDILRLVVEAEKDETKKIAVFGSRFLGEYKNKFSLHYFANSFLTFFTNILFSLDLTDMETCLKLCPVQIIKDFNLKSERFEFEPEITARLAKSKIKIKEISISYARRTYKQGKKIKFKDGLMAIKTLLKEKFFKED